MWEEKEQELISKYKSLGHDLLNIDKGGKGVVTDEKRNIDGKIRSVQGHYKAIVLLDCSGNFIDKCESGKEVCEKYGISKSAIGNVLQGRSRTAKGYYLVTAEIYDSSNFNAVEFVKSKNCESKVGKFIYQFDLNGNLINTYPTLTKVPYDRSVIARAIERKWNYRNSFWAKSDSINIEEFTIRKELIES